MNAEIRCLFVHGTTHAWLIEADNIYGLRMQKWIPKSQISYTRTEPVKPDQPGYLNRTIHIPVWLAENNNFEYEEIG